MTKGIFVELPDGTSTPFDPKVVEKRIRKICKAIKMDISEDDVQIVTTRAQRLVKYLFNTSVTTSMVETSIRQSIYRYKPQYEKTLLNVKA